MEPVTLILTALAAGAGLGMKDAASAAVTDAYNGLKVLVLQKLAGRPDGEPTLARHEQNPQVWARPLARELTAAGVAEDQDLIAAAHAVIRLVDAAGFTAGKYQVVIHGSQGLQIGDHNIQHNTFGPYTTNDLP